jgi:3-oxoacyl-[acyl-carrier protein] reductase
MIVPGDLAVVTGGSRGIGQETALWLARRGYRVLITYQRGENAAARVAEACRLSGAPEAWAQRLDLQDSTAIEGFARNLIDRFGSVPLLINNAGVIVWKRLEEQTEEEVRRQLATNLTGAILLTRALLPQARVILNVASDLSRFGMAELTVYCATKFGLRGFTQALAAERPGLRILCINPDRTATGMNDFQGREPCLVAEVIGRAAEGFFDIPNGGDVNVWELIALDETA